MKTGLQEALENNPLIKAALQDRSVEEMCGVLNRYIDEIILFNDAYGLISVQKNSLNDKGRAEIIVRHILDSFCALGAILYLLGEESAPRGGIVIADAGSGAGLPGIPLAVALPQHQFILIERMTRRVNFLHNVKAVLSLNNVEIRGCSIENVPPCTFDIVCFRALTHLEQPVLKKLLALLKPKGALAAYKGRTETINEEMQRIKNVSWTQIPYKVPFLNEERHIVGIRANNAR